MMKRYELVIYGRYLDDELITIWELSRLVGLHPDKLRRYIVLGLLDPVVEKPEPLFEESIVARVHKIERLKNDLGLNLAGCGLVLDLLEKIAELEEQLERLQR
ncbi:chaperone modulator CbpM [Desulfopila sp. IMCC35008]|uniref:chaperone modulator CbpM n=1 Tax=Desulfopila sp. IMCC35008 TaxID=2653858 RepID=UPI0013CF99AC|nr:chaperone modulator CbpM [Desulfopila sp. IMCC35008]